MKVRILVLSILGCMSLAVGQSAPATSTAPAAREMVQLNFPENIEIKALVDYVAARLNINVLFQDEAVARKRVTITSPARIPRESLRGLLDSILKMSGLAMVDAEQPGWKKIVATGDMLAITEALQTSAQDLARRESTSIVSQVFPLRYATQSAVEQTIKPLLSKPGGNSFAIPDGNLLIVTDYAGNLRRVAELIALLDRPGKKPQITFVTARHQDVGDLARQVSALLADRDRLAGKTTGLVLSPIPRTNQIAVISMDVSPEDATELIAKLDVPLDLQTRTYQLRHTSPQRIDRLMKDYAAAEAAKGAYKCTIDDQAGMLLVTTSPALHERLGQFIAALDVPPPPREVGHIRFYKLVNTTAASVLATIRSMESSEEGLPVAELTAAGQHSMPGGEGFAGPNYPPPAPGEPPPTPPAYQPTTAPASQPTEQAPPGSTTTVRTKDAIVTADVNTNTIIVVAPPEVQVVYERLITMLDKRRPQVMIEITLVTIDASDSISLGVELARLNAGENRSLIFTSFGLSAIDQATGTLALTPGTGFNGVLISPETISAVIRALATSGKAQVVSAPKVLVNDNATATLSGVSEAPFTSINASQTVSTTSFAGYASAGTTITVTPHISEGDHLQLVYCITLNSFTGTGTDIAPPPRQTNSLSSEVTVPDGYAVVVGGLTRENRSETASMVPYLGDIPILGYAFGSRSKNTSGSTLFVFIRPVILRDDRFKDLKYLSDRDLQTANRPLEMPSNEPLLAH